MSEQQGNAREDYNNAASQINFNNPYSVFQYAGKHKELSREQFEAAYIEALRKFPDTPSVRYSVACMHLNFLKHNIDDLTMDEAEKVLYHAERHFRAAIFTENENNQNKQAYLTDYIEFMISLSQDKKGFAQEKAYETVIDAIAMHMQHSNAYEAKDLFTLGAVLEARGGYDDLAFAAFGRADAENRKRPDQKQDPKISDRYKNLCETTDREYRKTDWTALKQHMAERAEIAHDEVSALTGTSPQP